MIEVCIKPYSCIGNFYGCERRITLLLMNSLDMSLTSEPKKTEEWVFDDINCIKKKVLIALSST